MPTVIWRGWTEMAKRKDPFTLPQGVIGLLQDPESVKIIGTLNQDGSAHVVVSNSLAVVDRRLIAFGEELEKSQSNKNMVRSIWFDKPVTINVTKQDQAYLIRAKTYKCLIVGNLFQEFLLRARAVAGSDADISTVWMVIPEDVRNLSAALLRHEQERLHPYFDRHLDRASIRK